MERQPQTITPEVVSILQEQFLGKKIRVEDDKGRTWAGRCEFIGTNPFFPSWELQVVISRTPVTNVKINSIQLSK